MPAGGPGGPGGPASEKMEHMIRTADLASELFVAMGLDPGLADGGGREVRTPIDGSLIGSVLDDDPVALEESVGRAVQAFERWRSVPAPRRGELVRRYGETLRQHKDALGRLVTLETGKILSEGLGEVQEMIDICDFAVGLSRQLYGRTIASERPGHRLMEQWQPLGPIAVITAFNFPVAVWSWNAAIALVCGDAVIWKPSEKTPLTAVACTALLHRVIGDDDPVLTDLGGLALGGRHVGEALADDVRLPLVSATGSTVMGRALGPRVTARFGRALLELGGNNAMIVAPSADLDLARRAIVFSAVGTAGQRCTSLRRVIAHQSIYGRLVESLTKAYVSVPIGNPLDDGTLMGPLIDGGAFTRMEAAIVTARKQGGTVHGGGRVLEDRWPEAFYVNPSLIEMPAQTPIVEEETFAPILYVMPYGDIEEAIAIQNGVPQGLSSSIFTTDVREAELFVSPEGSDCGIANINVGPSGAEIGGAFGGEKATGGGREAGSDAWKAYMRRTTVTVNYSRDLPLAQGVRFDLGD
jgi:aldehyde dehydrogenase (NAD+)